jgi:hypothetical protein
MNEFIHQSFHPNQVAGMQIKMQNALQEQAIDCLAVFWEGKGATGEQKSLPHQPLQARQRTNRFLCQSMLPR